MQWEVAWRDAAAENNFSSKPIKTISKNSNYLNILSLKMFRVVIGRMSSRFVKTSKSTMEREVVRNKLI